MRCQSPPLLSCYCWFPILYLLMFALCIKVLICCYIYICNCYIILLNWSLDHYIVSFFVSLHGLYYFFFRRYWNEFNFNWRIIALQHCVWSAKHHPNVPSLLAFAVILKEMRIPNHLTCLLRNLYADQEATVRTGHGTTDWFQIGEGVCQGCTLSLCLFNFF